MDALLKASSPAGTTIRLRYAEMLNPDGTVYLANLGAARATDYYAHKGDPNGETYESRIAFHGFRYVEMVGYPGNPSRDDITGVVLHSDNPVTGSFECSDPLINQLQRNERLGWTGDAQVFCRAAAYLTDAAGFFAKWLQHSGMPQAGHELARDISR